MNSPFTWSPPPADLHLPAHEVHVWRTRLDVSPAQFARDRALLAADEAARVDAARSVRGRQHFAVARATLRRILARYLSLRPAQIPLEATSRGKPQIAETHNHHDLHFNVAHSGDMALYVVARGRRVGVDVEQLRSNVAVARVASRYFAPREVAALLALPVAQQHAGFFCGWTRKEAYCKARGRGLSQGLGSFEVSMSPAAGPAEALRLQHSELGAAEVARWSLFDVPVGRAYVAALAVEAQGDEIKLRTWWVDEVAMILQ